MIRKLLTLSIAAILLIACSAKLDKKVEETYDDGTPKTVRYYKPVGEQELLVREITYYPGEKMRYDGQYKDGKKHGKWIYYYDNGNKWSEGYFFEGERDGESTTWYKNGQMYIHGQYTKGIRTGLWQFWNEEGELLKKINYDEE